MKTRLFSVVALFLVGSCGAWAEALPRDVLERMAAVDVVILGEVHDNPEHHENQRYVLNALKPRAVVWEMLTPEQAAEQVRQPFAGVNFIAAFHAAQVRLAALLGDGGALVRERRRLKAELLGEFAALLEAPGDIVPDEHP